jgi:hypothetical protein
MFAEFAISSSSSAAVNGVLPTRETWQAAAREPS